MNRYAYVLNNALRYIDPTGHWYYDPGCDCLVSGGAKDSGVNDYPTYLEMEPDWTLDDEVAPAPPPKGGWCDATLSECHGEGYTELDVFERVEGEEFEDLLETVASDLSNMDTPPVHPDTWLFGYIPGGWAGRGRYDTPFWDAGSDNTYVCIEGHGCYARSEVNYLAQGMWGAASGENLETTLKVTENWNQYVGQLRNLGRGYGHPATAGELYWTEFGYQWYLQWSAE